MTQQKIFEIGSIVHLQLFMTDPFYGFMISFNNQDKKQLKCAGFQITLGHFSLHGGIYHAK